MQKCWPEVRDLFNLEVSGVCANWLTCPLDQMKLRKSPRPGFTVTSEICRSDFYGAELPHDCLRTVQHSAGKAHLLFNNNSDTDNNNG